MQTSTDGTAWTLEGLQNAPVVVLIHGLGLSSASTWGAFAPVLAQTHRVLSYDLPGHGASAPAAGPVTLTSLATQLIAVLDEIGAARATLVGFSLGGMINRRVALDHPGRVSGLAILNSPHERAPDLQAKVEQQAHSAAGGGPAATIDAALERWFTPDFHASDPETVARIRATVLASDPPSYAAHRRVLAEGVRELIRPDPALRCPALVVTCENDTGSSPDMARAIAAEIPGAALQIVPGLRHLGLIERPDLFLPPLRAFLERVPR